MITIASPADLDRANIHLAWAFAGQMTAEHFEQLCEATVRQLGRRDAAIDVRRDG